LADSPFTAVPGGIRACIRLAPKAARTRIGAVQAAADGHGVLKVSVTAAPEGGKANAALIKTLAKAWRLPRSSLAITAGATDRNKTVFIDGDADVLAAKLNQWMERDHE
jgi:uncharacterized protein YggU (UPF0235/DUF167 family)